MQEESTKLEYDFENIQAVLQDRFLFGKPLIDTSKEVSWLYIYMYIDIFLISQSRQWTEFRFTSKTIWLMLLI